jgi:hypothetical protein
MDESKRGLAGGSRGGSRRNATAELERVTGSSIRDPNGSTSQAEEHSNTSDSSESGNKENSGIVDRVRSRAAAELSTQKDRATDGIGSVANAVRRSTQELRDQHHETVAGYIEQAADQLDRLSSRLRNKDVGELMRDAQNLARRQPMMFVGSALVVGFAAARFLKSSPPEPRRGSWQQPSASGASYRGNPMPTASSGLTAGVSAGEERYGSSPSESRVRPATERDTKSSVGWETR